MQRKGSHSSSPLSNQHGSVLAFPAKRKATWYGATAVKYLTIKSLATLVFCKNKYLVELLSFPAG
jgi:hypothetical protein